MVALEAEEAEMDQWRDDKEWAAYERAQERAAFAHARGFDGTFPPGTVAEDFGYVGD